MTDKHLIQLLLPVYAKDGEAIAGRHFQHVRHQLTEKFGGVTVYSRSPAEGLWKSDQQQDIHDDVVLFEVVVAELNVAWWQEYLKALEQQLSQDEIHCRVQAVTVFD